MRCSAWCSSPGSAIGSRAATSTCSTSRSSSRSARRLIVVKLLREKFELKVLSGRLTLGVLVVQDIWAILFMAVQPSLADPGVLTIARSIAGAPCSSRCAFLASRHVLSRVFEAARAPARAGPDLRRWVVLPGERRRRAASACRGRWAP